MMSEEEIGAVSLTLVGQPRLWPSLRLPLADAAAASGAPWTQYWTTRLDGTLKPATARSVYSAAHSTFASRCDRTGALLTAAAVIETFYVDEVSLDALDEWIAHLQRWLPDAEGWETPELESQVMACGTSILLRDPMLELLAQWAERGAVLVRHLASGVVRSRLAAYLVQYHLWRGEFSKTSLLLDTLPGLDAAGLMPQEMLLWHESVATHSRFTGQFERGHQAVRDALDLAAKHGLAQHLYALHTHGAALALADSDGSAAQAHVDAMRPILDGLSQSDQTHYWHLLAGLDLLAGRPNQAVEHARTALTNSLEIGGPYRTAAHRLSLGLALMVSGDVSSAQDMLAAAARTASSIQASLLEFSAGLMRSAALAQLARDDEADEILRRSLSIAAASDFAVTSGWWMPSVVAERLARALVLDIESEYVRRFIRRRRLTSPSTSIQRWPWPLRIFGFGEFRMLLDDAPLASGGGRSQQRPLDLVRVVLAHDSRPLPVATALEWLWPEADREAQRKAFDSALLRLRRLLGDDELVQLEGGHLRFAPGRAWSDVGALSDISSLIGSASDAAELTACGEALLSLVRGPFLPDVDTPWAQTARERFRRRFVLGIARVAEALEGSNPEHAAQLYERALDIDPLAESLSRRLMRLHARCGEHAEAVRAWLHCKAMLSLAAGLVPSPETRALALQLGLQAPSPHP